MGLIIALSSTGPAAIASIERVWLFPAKAFVVPLLASGYSGCLASVFWLWFLGSAGLETFETQARGPSHA